MLRFSKTKLIRSALSLIVVFSGIGAKNYIDSQEELTVNDIVEVLESKGVNHGGLLHATGKIKNKSDIDNVKVEITVEFMDKNQKVLKTVVETNDDLDAGEVWNFDVVSLGKASEYYSISYIEVEYE